MADPEHKATFIRLRCLDTDHAATVTAELTRPGDEHHNVRQEGEQVVITYDDIRWPMDVAEWAFDHGHCHDDQASRVVVAAQTGGDSD